VASGATAPGPTLEGGGGRFRPKVVHKQETILRIIKKKLVRQVAKVDLV
jgi:hypothetical protein